MAVRGWTRWLPSSLPALHSSSCVGTKVNGMALCALWRQRPWNMLAASGVAQALRGSMILPDVTTGLNKRKMRTSQRNWCLTASLRVCPVRANTVWGRQGRSPLSRIHRQCLLQPLWSVPRYVPTVCKTTVQVEKGESWSCWAKRQDDAEVEGLQKDRGVWGKRKHKGKSLFPSPREVCMS